MPTWRAMAAAVRPLSPVIITVDRSMWCSAARAGTESGLMVSATARTPAVGRRLQRGDDVLPSAAYRSAISTAGGVQAGG